MSDKTTADLTLERVNRLTLALADMADNQNAQGRQFLTMFQSIEAQLVALAKGQREMASEIVLLGNRVENALSRALRLNIRLDDLEDHLRESPHAE